MKSRVFSLLSLLGLLLLSLTTCTRNHEAGPIVIGVRTSNCQAPFFIADHHSLYDKRGLDATVQLVSSNTEIIEAMQRGDIQVGSLPVTTAIVAISRGAPLRIVAATGRGSDGILVRREDGLSDIAHLKGKKIATIRASILDVLLRQTLEAAQLDPDRDVELVYMSKLGDMISALKTGQVDATSNTEPFMTDAERQGWGQILTYYTATWPAHLCCIVLARDDFLENNPQAARDILAVHCDAIDWANTHVDETAEIIVDTLQAFDAELVRDSLHPTKMVLDYHLEQSNVEQMARLMLAQGLIDNVPKGALVDTTPLNDVLRERQ